MPVAVYSTYVVHRHENLTHLKSDLVLQEKFDLWIHIFSKFAEGGLVRLELASLLIVQEFKEADRPWIDHSNTQLFVNVVGEWVKQKALIAWNLKDLNKPILSFFNREH